MQLPWFSSTPVQRAAPAVAKTTNEPMDLKMTTSAPSANPTTSTAYSNPIASTLSSTPVAPSQLAGTTLQHEIQGQHSSPAYISPYISSPPAPATATAPASAPPPPTASTSDSPPPASAPATYTPPTTFPLLSASTTALLARVTSTPTPPNFEAARLQILSQMTTTHDLAFPNPSNPTLLPPTSGRRGRGGRPNKRASPAARGTIKVLGKSDRGGGNDDDALVKIEPDTTPGSNRGRGRGRGRGGGRPRGSGRGGTRGGKRKRSDSAASSTNGKRANADGGDTSSSETYTPLPTQSRSGRPLLKPPTFTPFLPAAATNGFKKRKRAYRRPGEASVCKNCGRGHSPASNAIVFCDGCNGAWHQFCHDPPIGADVVREVEREWVCGGCVGGRKVGGEGWGVEEKRQYFSGLPHAELVSLLLHASTLHPDLPLFAHDARAATPPLRAVEEPAAEEPAVEEELITKSGNDEVVDLVDVELEYEDLLPYPKAGNGIKLPPESEDLDFLIDDDTVAFSHSWRDVGGGFVGEGFVSRGFMDGGGLGWLSVGA